MCFGKKPSLGALSVTAEPLHWDCVNWRLGALLFFIFIYYPSRSTYQMYVQKLLEVLQVASCNAGDSCIDAGLHHAVVFSRDGRGGGGRQDSSFHILACRETRILSVRLSHWLVTWVTDCNPFTSKMHPSQITVFETCGRHDQKHLPTSLKGHNLSRLHL